MGNVTVEGEGRVFVDATGIIPGLIIAAGGQVGAVLEAHYDSVKDVVHALGVDDNGELFVWGQPTHGGLDEVSGEIDPIAVKAEVRLLGTTGNVTSIAPLANDLEAISVDVASAIEDSD